jgi:hypothetical protein
LIAAKEKTTWNTRRELSDKRGGEEDNWANLQHVPANDIGEKEKAKKYSSQGTATRERKLQDSEEQPRAPKNHAGRAWRYRARVDSPREDGGNSNEP